MDDARLRSWLAAYGRAWESRDPDAAAALFADQALYRVTPFQEPMHGFCTRLREWWHAKGSD